MDFFKFVEFDLIFLIFFEFLILVCGMFFFYLSLFYFLLSVQPTVMCAGSTDVVISNSLHDDPVHQIPLNFEGFFKHLIVEGKNSNMSKNDLVYRVMRSIH